MTKKELIIVKLGGSIVTLKHAKAPALRRLHVEQIATLIARNYNPAKHSLIIIHGAGSFGHIHAHRHKLALGTKDHPEKLYRAVENQSLDAVLNTEIATIFVAAGLPVTGMPTRTLAVNTSGKLKSLETKSIRTAIAVGAIPLLHGDMIFDMAWGLSICSGDVLVSEFARIFGVKKVFFASDVDGIFSKDPHTHKDALLIKTTTLREITSGTLKLGKSHHVDVTGGLSKKFTLFSNIPSLKNIYLFNGLTAKNFSFLFSLEHFFGTTISIKKGE